MAYVRCAIAGTDGAGCEVEADYAFGGLSVCVWHYNVLKECARVETEQWVAREDEKRAWAEARSIVYYLQRRDSLIKIGYTTCYRDRRSSLERDHGPLELLAWHRGHRGAELHQHRTFADDRVEGEWFLPSDELLDHVARIRQRTSSEKPEDLAFHGLWHGEPIRRRCPHGASRKAECSTCKCEANAARKRREAVAVTA